MLLEQTLHIISNVTKRKQTKKGIKKKKGTTWEVLHITLYCYLMCGNNV